MNHTLPSPDLVYIDGRFRVVSALMAILRLSVNSMIMIHDFLNRPAYYDLLKYTELVDCVNTMVLLMPKENYDASELKKEMKKYLYNIY
jgi:hypothetical protein